MSIQNLPPEIRQNIFHFLPRQDVYSCMFVCKLWSTSANEVYHKEITLSNYNASILYSKLLDNSCGHRVKKLKIHNDNTSPRLNLEPEELADILIQLPNLKIIDLATSSSKTLWYMDVFSAVVDNEKCLNNIEEISIPNEREVPKHVMDPYFSICHKLRRSISHLFLNHLQEQFTIDDCAGNCLRFLPDFTKLTHLSVYNNSSSNGDKNIAIFSVFKDCPHLIELNYESKYPIPDIIVDDSLLEENSTSQMKPLTILKKYAPPQSYDMQPLSQYYNTPKLKILRLNLPYLTVPNMKYIISQASPHLDTFELRMTDFRINFFGYWVQKGVADDKTDAIMELASHLNSIKNLTIRLKEDRIFSASSGVGKDRFWQFLNTIKGHRHPICKANLHIVGSDSTYPYERYSNTASIKMLDDQETVLEYYWNIILINHDYYYGTPTPILFGSYNATAEPHKISSLDIYIERQYNIRDSCTAQLIQMAINSCPHLMQLSVNFDDPLRKYVFKSSVNESSSYTQGSSHTFNGVTAIENLSQAVIYDSALSTELINNISENLVNIKLLQCIDCRFVTDLGNSVTLDLRGYQRLEQLDLCIKNLKFDRLDYVFIQIQLLHGRTKCLKSKRVKGEKNQAGNQVYIFLPQTENYIMQHGRYKSRDTSVITIKCGSHIEKLTLTDIETDNTFVF